MAQPSGFTAANFVRVSDAIGRLAKSLAWPLIVLAIFAFYHSPISKFIESTNEATIKIAGNQLTFKRSAEAAAAITKATIAASTRRNDVQLQPDIVGRAVAAAQNAATALSPAEAERKSILWVDDTPANNEFERQAFLALGLSVIQVTSTAEALRSVATKRYSLIISDMRRGDEQEAGLDLLRSLRDSGDRTPVIFYTGSFSPENRDRAIRRGAFGETNRADELITLAIGALKSSS
jgi:CheY-like chemotaxis protein